MNTNPEYGDLQPEGRCGEITPEPVEHGYEREYRQWRDEELRRMDCDYEDWRNDRMKKFLEDFNTWRAIRVAQSGLRTGAGRPMTQADFQEELRRIGALGNTQS